MDIPKLEDELGLGDHERPLLTHWLEALDSTLEAGAVPDEHWVILLAGFWADHLGLDETQRGILAARLVEHVLGREADAGGELARPNLDAGTAATVFDRCIDVLADCADVDETVDGQTALEVAAQELMRLRDATLPGGGGERDVQT